MEIWKKLIVLIKKSLKIKIVKKKFYANKSK